MDLERWFLGIGIIMIVMLGVNSLITEVNTNTNYRNLTNVSIDLAGAGVTYNQTGKFLNLTNNVYDSTFRNSTQLSSISSLLISGWNLVLVVPSMIPLSLGIIGDILSAFGVDPQSFNIVLGIIGGLAIISLVLGALYFLFRIGRTA